MIESVVVAASSEMEQCKGGQTMELCIQTLNMLQSTIEHIKSLSNNSTPQAPSVNLNICVADQCMI